MTDTTKAPGCEYCVDGLQADGKTPCPCQIKPEMAAIVKPGYTVDEAYRPDGSPCTLDEAITLRSADEIRNEALEEAARVCDKERAVLIHQFEINAAYWAKNFRDDIRALKSCAPKPAENDMQDLFNAAMVRAEMAMKAYPQPNYVISKVAEEAGEVVKAAIHCAEGRDTKAHVVEEITDAMAMLIRLYLEGDQVHGLAPLAEKDGA